MSPGKQRLSGLVVSKALPDYVLPLWLVPLKPLIVMYLKWSMKKELRDMKDMILA